MSETNIDRADKAARHQLSSHRLYPIWNAIKQRTTNKNNKDYAEYGGRGIGLCKEWMDSPANFIEWALDNDWHSPLQVDRIDNDKGYSPTNCRLVTPKENANNRRNSPKDDDT